MFSSKGDSKRGGAIIGETQTRRMKLFFVERRDGITNVWSMNTNFETNVKIIPRTTLHDDFLIRNIALDFEQKPRTTINSSHNFETKRPSSHRNHGDSAWR